MKKNTLLLLFLLSVAYLLAQQRTVGLFLNDEASFEGYTLFSPDRNSYLIDNCGRLVNSWESRYQAGLSAYLLETGQLLRPGNIGSAFPGNGLGGRIELFDWEGNLEWSYDYASAAFHQHHDIEPMPNGNILLIAWERKTREEAIEAGRDSNTVGAQGIWLEHIVELQPLPGNEAEIVWSWHVWNHLVQDLDSTKANYGKVADHPHLFNFNYLGASRSGFGQREEADWMHFNAIDYHPERDEIAVSSRIFNEIYIIDHSTTRQEAATQAGGRAGRGGSILYRWGNPEAYERGTSDDRVFFLQHDVRWVPSGHPDAGALTVFNNGDGRPSGRPYSSVDLFHPPLDSSGNYVLEADAAFGPTEISWTYTAAPPNSFFAPIMSGAHRLPNGNTLICEADGGHFFEVDTIGRMVWEYVNPLGFSGPVNQGERAGFQSVFRATRYPPSYPAFHNRELPIGQVIEGNPLPSDCRTSLDESTTSLSAAFHLSDLQILQNPFREVIQLQNNKGEQFNLTISDLNGRRLASYRGNDRTITIFAGNWTAGIYFLTGYHESSKYLFSEKILKL